MSGKVSITVLCAQDMLQLLFDMFHHFYTLDKIHCLAARIVGLSIVRIPICFCCSIFFCTSREEAFIFFLMCQVPWPHIMVEHIPECSSAIRL